MKAFNKLNYLLKFVICITIVFILLELCVLIFVSKDAIKVDKQQFGITIANIKDEKENYIIDVNYPKYNNDKLNKIITDWLYEYIKEFKKNAETSDNKLIINYKIYNIDCYDNVLFEIENSLNKRDTIKNILVNLIDKNKAYITDIYDAVELQNKISKVSMKYPKTVSDLILNEDVDSFTYEIDDNGLIVYFKNIEFKNISYEPYIDLRENIEKSSSQNKKTVAVTFDDGPSKYTLDILECLLLNDSKATFFELGNKMKSNKETINKLLINGMEIGNHTYSHKKLTEIKSNEILSQINNTTSIFEEVTGNSMTLMRAPYGSVNSTVKSLAPYPIILWDIDTNDWLYKDPNKSYSVIMSNVQDGDIILMHDMYEPTVELVKMAIPELKGRGFDIVTVSELARIKNKKLNKGEVIRRIK